MSAWEGQDLKFAVNVESLGFDVDRDDFKLVLKRGSNTAIINKSQFKRRDNMLILPIFKEVLSQLGSGDIYAVFYADIPDSDFDDDGLRTEVDKQLITKVNRV